MIDVLIPAFNSEKTVAAALESILNQSVTDIRVLAIDDGSTDATGEILLELSKRDPRVEIITTRNRGIVDALNTGLSRCRADIVARHDADDIAYPDRFARQLAYLQANPDCVAVGASAWHIDGNGRKIGMVKYRGDVEGDASRIPSGDPYLLHPFLMVRRSAMNAIGGYRYVFHAEDIDLYWRLKPLGRLHNLDSILGEYRIHAGSVTSRSVLNARIAAVTSQLAALSTIRRAAGREDILFDPALLREYERANSLTKIVDLASSQLDADERAFLAIAAAAKFVEIRHYRRFRFTNEDRLYVARILGKHLPRLDWETRKRLISNVLYLLRPKFGLRKLALRVFPQLATRL